MRKLESIQAKVLEILKTNTEARNDDMWKQDTD